MQAPLACFRGTPDSRNSTAHLSTPPPLRRTASFPQPLTPARSKPPRGLLPRRQGGAGVHANLIQGRNLGPHSCVARVPGDVALPVPNGRAGVGLGGAGRGPQVGEGGPRTGGKVTPGGARALVGERRRSDPEGQWREAPPGGGAATRVLLSGLPPVAAPL